MAERTSTVKKYRDLLESVIQGTMDFIIKGCTVQSPSIHKQRESRESNIRQDQQAVQSLLRLSAQQEPTHIPPSQPRSESHPVNAWQTSTHDSSSNSISNISSEIESHSEEPRPFAAYDEFGDGLQNDVVQDQELYPMGDALLYTSRRPGTWEGDRFTAQMLNELLS